MYHYRVYSGHNSILIAPSELERDSTAWLTAVSQYKVRDTFCSYGVMEMCTRGLGATTSVLKVSSEVYSHQDVMFADISWENVIILCEVLG